MEKGNAFQQMVLGKLNVHVGKKKKLVSYKLNAHVGKKKNLDSYIIPQTQTDLRFQCKA